MGQLNSKRRRICPIDILSDDALLIVFTHLPILDKIKNVRVCQKWKHLLRHPSVWRTIDFTQLSHYLKPMSYAEKQTAVLQFLQKYAGHSTKQVRLQNFASNEILEFLNTNCTQLEGIALFVQARHGDVDLALLPPNLKSIDLRLPISGGDGTSVGKFAEQPFSRLLHLNLHGVQVTEALCSSLLHSKSLRYLMLFHCVFHSNLGSKFLTLMSELRGINKLVLAYCSFPSTEQLEEILNIIAVECRKLESFDFRFPYMYVNFLFPFYEIADINFDSFLKSSVQMDILTKVSLTGINGMSSEGFGFFSQQHDNLETLELSSCTDVDDNFLYTIATDLVKLKLLVLKECDNVTNVGFKFLAYHPCLQNLSLACSNITGKAVTTTVSTLPKVKHLILSKVHGYKKCAVTLRTLRPDLTISFK